MIPGKYLLTLGLIFGSAASTYFVTSSTAQQGTQPQPARADNEYQVAAILYQQTAAEYRALCYQAFNWGKIVLNGDEKTKKKLPKIERKKPRAVVVDIDETVLDNSPAQAYLVKNRLPFDTKGWHAWGEMRKARAVPGAVNFLNYAVSKGVKIFYVSNRDDVQKQATMENLKNVGFQDVSDENVVLRTTESSKEARRSAISEKYRIVILMGDNLDDLSNVFERKSSLERFAETDKLRAMFGNKFIVLPNAMYGTWENAVYEYGRLNEVEKGEKRASAMTLP
jgi:5'-nucleotidase (lipoprotein e(P4) family)